MYKVIISFLKIKLFKSYEMDGWVTAGHLRDQSEAVHLFQEGAVGQRVGHHVRELREAGHKVAGCTCGIFG